MLKRTDWRALQQSADDASEPIQLALRFSLASRAAHQNRQRENKATEAADHDYEREDDKE